MSSIHFFVVDIEEKEPAVHSLDIYVGEKEPDISEGVTEIRVFEDTDGLKSFLMRGDWDRATIYKSTKCPREVVEELTDWMDLHMSLNRVTTLNEDKDEKDDNGG
jgi:hypothetical protein